MDQFEHDDKRDNEQKHQNKTFQHTFSNTVDAVNRSKGNVQDPKLMSMLGVSTPKTNLSF